MVLDKLHQMILQAQFTVLRSNIREINLYYRAYGQCIYIFQICDMTKGFRLGNIPYHNSLEQIREKFCNDGYQQVEILSIIYTDDPFRIRQLAAEEKGVWVIDALRNVLMVYENQPSDYMAIRQPLETMLSEEPVLIKKKKNFSHITPINTSIVLLNVLVFVVLEIIGNTQDAQFMVRYGAMYTSYIINYGQLWRIFTSMFLHFGADHLMGNMVMLLLLGDNLERAYGKWRYLSIYLLSGIGAGMFSFIFNLMMGENVVAAGASGAIFGVIGALIYVGWKNKGHLAGLSALRLSILVIYILYSGITTPGIDNAAHIGGLITGFLLAVILFPRKGILEERRRKK